MNVVERIADGLRIPGHMLGATKLVHSEAAPTLLAEFGIGKRPETFPAAADAHDLDSVPTTAAGTKITSSTLRSLQTSIADYWRRDDEHGGETLRPAVIG
ncbi:hypothetical protein ACFO3J_28135 [Streptomyces polygonati]|uniref:Uncharacterized protein n=1 Tax=Streptomyces polygonati TaxID=1617087 RepID=A0ABV8HWC0_9ACTN